MSQKWKSWLRAGPVGAEIKPTSECREPSLIEALLMLATTFVLHFWTVCRVRSFWTIAATWPDNPSYINIATVIRNWHFSGGDMPHHFWGFPYLIALVSKLFSIPELMAVVVISLLGSFTACLLVHRLYGGWVATTFVFINYEWIILSVEGSSEPLFMCLLFASFLAARSNRWNLAALLASFATTVRPVGVLALLAFAIVLAGRRYYRQLAVITLIGLVIGILYMVPLWIIVGRPFANFTGYSPDWGHHGWPITYPFGVLVPAYLTAIFSGTRWYTLVFLAAWPVFALVSTLKIWGPGKRQNFLAPYPAEALFATIYVSFFLSYPYTGVIWYFSRFLIPVLPLLLFSLRDWIPKDRRVLWAATVLSALLSSAAMVGLRNVFGFRLF
jgi:Gpi18-like mannosyltransferase